MLKAVRKTRASADVVKQIANLITNGRLKKGDQLPAERELTEAFQVSRATVREAIRSLESMGLVKSKHGNGTYVLVSGEEAGIAPLAASLLTEKDDLLDIFHIRKIIEPSIAQLAAGYASSEDIKELEEILKRQRVEVAAGKYAAETDTRFHLTLARIARNRVLSRLLHALVELLADSRARRLDEASRAVRSLHGHENIVAAVAREDCTGARQSMLNHLSEVEGLFRKKKRGGGKCIDGFEE
jgi:GntR family transcriptional repressor for pyruvate dehydrogenase complex